MRWLSWGDVTVQTCFSGPIGRRASVIVVLTLAGSASAGAASGCAEQHVRPKPDLIVTNVGLHVQQGGFWDIRSDHGTFDYVFFTGPVTYTVQVTDSIDGCVWSGTGTYDPRDPAMVGELNLQFGPAAHYSASDFVDPKFFFPVTQTCPGHRTGTFSFSPAVFGVPQMVGHGPRHSTLRRSRTDRARRPAHGGGHHLRVEPPCRGRLSLRSLVQLTNGRSSHGPCLD